MLEAKVKLGFTRKRDGSLGSRYSPYELVSSDSVGADKFLELHNGANKGVGDKFSVSEFNEVASDEYYKVSVKVVK